MECYRLTVVFKQFGCRTIAQLNSGDISYHLCGLHPLSTSAAALLRARTAVGKLRAVIDGCRFGQSSAVPSRDCADTHSVSITKEVVEFLPLLRGDVGAERTQVH